MHSREHGENTELCRAELLYTWPRKIFVNPATHGFHKRRKSLLRLWEILSFIMEIVACADRLHLFFSLFSAFSTAPNVSIRRSSKQR